MLIPGNRSGPTGLRLIGWILCNTSGGSIVAQSGGFASGGGSAGNWNWTHPSLTANMVAAVRGVSSLGAQTNVNAQCAANALNVRTCVGAVDTGMLVHVEVWGP